MSRIRTPRTRDPDDQRQVVGLRGRRGPLRARARAPRARTAPTVRRSPGTRTRPLAAAAPDQRVDGGARGRRPGTACRSPPTPTSRPPSAPARPPTWSASRCDSSTSGSASMPSRSRQRSTGADVGAGVDEHRLPRGPVGSTQGVALPDVAGDDDRVRRRPAPDRLAQRPADQRPARPARPAASGRSRGKRHSAQPRRSRSDRQQDGAAGARRPAGRRVRQPRRPARRPATSQRVGQPASQTRTSPAGGDTAPTTVASQPEHGRRRAPPGRRAGWPAARPG